MPATRDNYRAVWCLLDWPLMDGLSLHLVQRRSVFAELKVTNHMYQLRIIRYMTHYDRQLKRVLISKI